jgi:hypothetical protein
LIEQGLVFEAERFYETAARKDSKNTTGWVRDCDDDIASQRKVQMTFKYEFCGSA